MRRRVSDPAIRVSVVSLGCPRNLVDSEVLVGKLAGGPFALQASARGADVVVINTCGFIDAARAESIDVICEMLALKAQGDVKGVVVAGCMVARYGRALARELPDVDAFLDISDYGDAPGLFRTIRARVPGEGSPARAAAGTPFFGGGRPRDARTDLTRARLTLPHTAYLRVSEGCDRRCSFCAIPQIRGRQRSRPLPVLVAEAENLAASGVKELCLVAEETTAYGRDLGTGGRLGLAQLLSALGGIDGLRWIRLLYAHPGSFRPELVAEIRDNDKVVKYVDMPIQHGDDEILKRMKRGTPAAMIRRLVADLRREVPGITLRTTVLVGFPGETERRFENLLALLEEMRFERLGCFTFSREEDTAAHALRQRPAARVAARRRGRVLALERRVIAERNAALVGRTIPVLIDRAAGGEAIGRGEGDAPDIDCSVRVRGAGLKAGTIVQVRVTGARGYDLEGKVQSSAGARR